MSFRRKHPDLPIEIDDAMVDRAVRARILLYSGKTHCKSIYDMPGKLLEGMRVEARAMLAAALQDEMPS